MSGRDIGASVRQRLLNKSRTQGRPFQELLQYFAMARFLYRLAKSPYSDRFELRVVDSSERKVAGFHTGAISQVMGGRFLSLPRGDLAATIFCKIEHIVETIFGDSVLRMDQDEKRVRVTFERGGERDFDLVIGADGLHSRVRELVFGAEQRFEKYLGYMVAGFQSDGYRPRDELVYLMFTELGPAGNAIFDARRSYDIPFHFCR